MPMAIALLFLEKEVYGGREGWICMNGVTEKSLQEVGVVGEVRKKHKHANYRNTMK